jgi:hypothetical protein
MILGLCDYRSWRIREQENMYREVEQFEIGMGSQSEDFDLAIIIFKPGILLSKTSFD